MKKSIMLFALAVLFMSGCSTKSSLHPADPAVRLSADARFAVAEVVDASGYKFEEEEEAFSLPDAMTGAMNAALSLDGMRSDDAQYVIKVRIDKYAPGNAFARWVLPGAGATKLNVESSICTKDNVVIAKLPVERSIAAGGAYTIKAWKYVFEDVAKETVRVMKEQLITPKG